MLLHSSQKDGLRPVEYTNKESQNAIANLESILPKMEKSDYDSKNLQFDESLLFDSMQKLNDVTGFY